MEKDEVWLVGYLGSTWWWCHINRYFYITRISIRFVWSAKDTDFWIEQIGRRRWICVFENLRASFLVGGAGNELYHVTSMIFTCPVALFYFGNWKSLFTSIGVIILSCQLCSVFEISGCFSGKLSRWFPTWSRFKKFLKPNWSTAILGGSSLRIV